MQVRAILGKDGRGFKNTHLGSESPGPVVSSSNFAFSARLSVSERRDRDTHTTSVVSRLDALSWGNGSNCDTPTIRCPWEPRRFPADDDQRGGPALSNPLVSLPLPIR